MSNFNDAESWTKKYKQSPNKLGAPDPFLVENLHYLKNGSVLDLACGDGRNSVFLAQQGFTVLGLDFSSLALARLKGFADISNVLIDTRELDLSKVSSLAGLGLFDNIIISRFKPTNEVFRELPKLLKPAGVLLICTFNFRQALNCGFSREYCLEENELVGKFPALHILKHQVFEDSEVFLDGYIFQDNC